MLFGRGLQPSRDTVWLSPAGKANSARSGLEKLKQQIEDRRSAFLSKTAEEGQSAETIQTQLEAFDQQLKEIDQQIAQISIQQTSQSAEKSRQTSQLGIKQPKTRQEVENQRLADITNMSAGLDQAEVVHTVKTQVDGGIRVQKTEIALEKARGGDTMQMEEELSEMQNRASGLTADIQDRLHGTLEKIEESNDQEMDAGHTDPEEPAEKQEEKDSTVEEKTAQG